MSVNLYEIKKYSNFGKYLEKFVMTLYVRSISLIVTGVKIKIHVSELLFTEYVLNYVCSIYVGVVSKPFPPRTI